MRTSLLHRSSTGAFVCLLLLLASCGPHVAQVPLQTAQNSIVNDRTTQGEINAARGIAVEIGQTPINAGLKGVLTAIQEPMPTVAFDATEFVILRRDGTIVAIVTRISGPDSKSLATAGGFSTGDKVQIIDGVGPALLRGD